MHKVLIVDDSALMRRLLSTELSNAGFEAATARDGEEAVQRVVEWQPDVVTLDINMPRMDGLTALSLIMEARPTPVVMVSSLTEQGAQATFEALALGAVDYVAKPGGTISLSIDEVSRDLVRKVKAAARARLRRGGGPRIETPRPVSPRAARRATRPLPATATLRRAGSSAGSQCPGLVMIGVSTGGPRTLEDILPVLPADFAWPVIVVQHMPANFTEAFARRLDTLCRLQVREARGTVPVEPGHVYVAQGGFDAVVVERLGRVVMQTRPESAQHLWHPSVDVLVDSAMALLPPERLIGVQLTGMGHDGADAMARLKAAGGRTIAESEESSVVFGMPAELIARGGATTVLASTQIAEQLGDWLP